MSCQKGLELSTEFDGLEQKRVASEQSIYRANAMG